jgi:cell division protein FtsQ
MASWLTFWSRKHWHDRTSNQGDEAMSKGPQRKSGRTVRRTGKSARSQVRQMGWFDRLLQSLPFSQDEVQRFLTRAVLAVVVVAGLVSAHWLGATQALRNQYGVMTAKAGFTVEDIEIVGTRRVDQMKVYDIILDKAQGPIMLVDIQGIRKDLTSYGWIKDVRISRQLPTKLFVEITERKPVAVWQHGDRYKLLDDEGKVLEAISASQIGNLPVVSGANANRHLVALGELLDNAQSLKAQVASATWVGNRRWDLRFRSGETLALPEGEKLAAQALVNFTRMDGIHRLLERNIIHFDLRDPDRMYMRSAPKATPTELKLEEGPKKAAQGEGSA